MLSSLIAVAVTEQGNVSPHAGRALYWQVYASSDTSPTPALAWTVTLTASGCLHEWHVREDCDGHPLHNVDIAIARSGGDGVKLRLAERDTQLVETAEIDPVKAVKDCLAGSLKPGQGHNETDCLNPEMHQSRAG